MYPIIGMPLHYKLTADQAERINSGLTGHNGNRHAAGDVVPLIVVRIWPNEFGDKPGVNGQALLDGAGNLWITSAGEGDGEGQWNFITANPYEEELQKQVENAQTADAPVVAEPENPVEPTE